VIAEWQAMAETGAFAALAQGLMTAHYDPRYAKHRARMDGSVTEIAVDRLKPGDLGAVADRVAQAVLAAARETTDGQGASDRAGGAIASWT